MTTNCKCTFAQKMAGSGCDTCNPEMAREIERDIKRGDIVTIRKGATVRSLSRGEYVLKRAQKVTVHLVTNGFTYEGRTRPSEVSWAGSGGYWCYADKADIVND